ncbi:hypothetical protein OQZ33_07815 [Pedobacter sp. MC2016-05]|uniref:hypothetical protein n=1 Tax=Pedobacter sp. MC2016-05 TaxID=2994474 RepID=UPI002245F3C1|nr:hypothetical protein [Pedobacter sp. MC2016-05]MCX2474230.1 hypothetical protein [Pedobacter sp. MC2016-05]
MKKIIGIFIVILVIAFVGILGLRIWNIEVVSLQTIIKSSATLLVLGIAIVVLIISYGFYFKDNSKGYDKSVGNRAHPKV